MEHLTTREGAQFVREARAGVAGTITPQHLLWNRNEIFRGGLRPHAYCLPVLKREVHRLALVAAATSGSPKYFLGTDSAPHARGAKESDCGCAGVYSAHAAIELYAEAFDMAGALDKLEGFASFHGPDFYGLPRNTSRIRLKKESWTVPASQPFGDTELKLRGIALPIAALSPEYAGQSWFLSAALPAIVQVAMAIAATAASGSVVRRIWTPRKQGMTGGV